MMRMFFLLVLHVLLTKAESAEHSTHQNDSAVSSADSIESKQGMRFLQQEQFEKQDSSSWGRTIFMYMIFQAVIGAIGIEYALMRTKRFRDVDEVRDGRFPWFRRYDAPNWTRRNMYPGAVLLMPTKFILLVLDGLFLLAVLQILTIGHDFSKGPLKKGCRKWIMQFFYHVCCSFFLIVAGMRTSLHYDDVDYSDYLGPNYKTEMKKVKRTSTLVCNHVSWLDCVILIKTIRPAFSPDAAFKNVPLLSTFIDCLDSIYIPRGGTEQNKMLALEQIMNRQELIEETGKYAPFLIFAEAGTSNGTSLIKFKKGAFYSEKTVRPLYLKYELTKVNPGFEVMEFLPLAILQLSSCYMKCSVHVLPDFQPNEHLFKKYAHQGNERWEVFAWAVRDVMARQGKFGICNVSLRQKVQYEAYMTMKRGTPHPNSIQINVDEELKQHTTGTHQSDLIELA